LQANLGVAGLCSSALQDVTRQFHFMTDEFHFMTEPTLSLKAISEVPLLAE